MSNTEPQAVSVLQHGGENASITIPSNVASHMDSIPTTAHNLEEVKEALQLEHPDIQTVGPDTLPTTDHTQAQEIIRVPFRKAEAPDDAGKWGLERRRKLWEQGKGRQNAA